MSAPDTTKPASVITAGGLRDSEQLGSGLSSQNGTTLNATQASRLNHVEASNFFNATTVAAMASTETGWPYRPPSLRCAP
jgi:hypothetical protein